MELVFILIILALLLLAFTLLIVLYKWLLTHGFRKLALLFPTLIIVVVGYGAYVSLVPRDSFYKEDFEKYSGVPFPASGNLALVDGDIGDPKTAAKIVDTALSRFG